MHILIVEDDAKVAEFVSEGFRREGHAVTLARDGEEGLAADLEMDLVTHRVVRAGRRIDLQPLEYQLLEYLMRNKGRVVSKTTIMDRVWDYAFDPRTNVVECRVSRLRTKITAPGEKGLIHTLRGFGYVLEER